MIQMMRFRLSGGGSVALRFIKIDHIICREDGMAEAIIDVGIWLFGWQKNIPMIIINLSIQFRKFSKLFETSLDTIKNLSKLV